MAEYTSSTNMPAWAQPIAESYLNRAQQTADTPYQGYGGDRVAGFTPWQEQGYGAMANRAANGSAVMNSAGQALQGMMSPTENPYLTQQIDRAQGDVVRNWNQVQMPAFDTAMSRSGSFGNANIGGMAQQAASDLQRNLGDIAGNMRGADYNAQQSRVLSALGMAPTFAQQDYADIDRLVSAGGAYQTQRQRGLDADYSNFTEARSYPQQQLDTLGNALGKAVGNSSSTTQTQPGASTASQVIGGALTFAQLMKLIGG